MRVRWFTHAVLMVLATALLADSAEAGNPRSRSRGFRPPQVHLPVVPQRIPGQVPLRAPNVPQQGWFSFQGFYEPRNANAPAVPRLYYSPKRGLRYRAW